MAGAEMVHYQPEAIATGYHKEQRDLFTPQALEGELLDGSNSIEVAEKEQEYCGLTAVYNFTDQSTFEQLNQLVAAGRNVQHRGPNGAGLAMQTKDGLQRFTAPGKVKNIFTADRIAELENHENVSWSLLQTRYGTDGDYGEDNLQPCLATAPDGTQVSVIHNGQFVAVNKMRQALPQEYPQGVSDSFLFTQYLANAPGKTWDEKVLNALNNVDGAISLVIGIGDTMYVAKGHLNIRPLFYGEVNGNLIAASETTALEAAGAEHLREVRRNQVLKITKENGIEEIREGLSGPGHICDMEDVYFTNPESKRPLYTQEDDWEHPERWITSGAIRENAGRILAREHPEIKGDFVVPIPASGIAAARAFAEALGIPYEELILKVEDERAFLQDHNLDAIKQVVLKKLKFLSPEKWEGKHPIFIDDSIIRGDSTGAVLQFLLKWGITGADVVSTYSPFRKPCYLGMSVRDESQLVAAGGVSAEEIAREIKRKAGLPDNFDLRIHFISREELTRARNPDGIVYPDNPEHIPLANGGCMGCASSGEGVYPISPSGELHPYVKQEEEERRRGDIVFVANGYRPLEGRGIAGIRITNSNTRSN